MRTQILALSTALVLALSPGFAQHGDLTHGQPASPEATVDFGILPTAPLGPAPCSQVAPFGGPADPCAYRIHSLTPAEVTVFTGGEVTYHVHGGGHGMAIYEVSKDTTREEVGQFLCAGADPRTIGDPDLHACNGAPGTANAQRAPHRARRTR